MTRNFIPSVWTLHCKWCTFYIVVNGRGMQGNDPGSGVEAADLMKEHVDIKHDKTWEEFTANEKK